MELNFQVAEIVFKVVSLVSKIEDFQEENHSGPSYAIRAKYQDSQANTPSPIPTQSTFTQNTGFLSQLSQANSQDPLANRFQIPSSCSKTTDVYSNPTSDHSPSPLESKTDFTDKCSEADLCDDKLFFSQNNLILDNRCLTPEEEEEEEDAFSYSIAKLDQQFNLRFPPTTMAPKHLELDLSPCLRSESNIPIVKQEPIEESLTCPANADLDLPRSSTGDDQLFAHLLQKLPSKFQDFDETQDSSWKGMPSSDIPSLRSSFTYDFVKSFKNSQDTRIQSLSAAWQRKNEQIPLTLNTSSAPLKVKRVYSLEQERPKPSLRTYRKGQDHRKDLKQVRVGLSRNEKTKAKPLHPKLYFRSLMKWFYSWLD